MPNLENSHQWTLTSTGTAKLYNARNFAQSLTVGVETSSGCTGVIQIIHRMGSSDGPKSVMSTVVSTLGQFQTAQFLGPLEWVGVRVTDKTASTAATVTVYLRGN